MSDQDREAAEFAYREFCEALDEKRSILDFMEGWGKGIAHERVKSNQLLEKELAATDACAARWQNDFLKLADQLEKANAWALKEMKYVEQGDYVFDGDDEVWVEGVACLEDLLEIIKPEADE